MHTWTARLFACFLLLATLSPAFAKGEEVLIKFATVAPHQSTWMQIMSDLDSQVREATAGRVGFKFYAGGVQGDEQDVIRKMRINQLQAGGFTGLGMGLIQPESRVLDLPFLFRDYAEVDSVREGLFETFDGLFQEKGFVLLGWAEVGFVRFFSQSPITSLDDLRRQKMWIWEGDPLAEAYFKALDLNPVPLALPDVLTSFQTGLINAAYASPYGASVLQWQSRVKHVSDVAMANAAGAVLVSQRAWKKIDPADRARIREIARRELRRLTLASRQENEVALQAFIDSGIPMVETSREDKRAFESLGLTVHEDLAGELYSRELLDQVRTIVQGQRAATGVK